MRGGRGSATTPSEGDIFIEFARGHFQRVTTRRNLWLVQGRPSPQPLALAARMSWKHKLQGGTLVFIGFLLSPLSWWNDLFVNVPLALGFAWLVSLLYPPAFTVAAVVGVRLAQLHPEAGHHVLLRDLRRAHREAEQIERPHPRVGDTHQIDAADARDVGHERRADGATPAHRPMQHRRHLAADVGAEPFECVHGAEHLRQRTTHGVQVELDMVGVAHQLVHAHGEAVPVDLIAVLQPRLHHTIASGDLVDEAADVGPQVVVDVRQIGGHDRRHQYRRVSGPAGPGAAVARGGHPAQGATGEGAGLYQATPDLGQGR